VCPRCLDGYYWQASTEEIVGNCAACFMDMAGCTKCHSSNRCVKCEDGLILKPDESGCIAPIAHCEDNPDNYYQSNGVWQCVTCSDGFFKNDETGGCDACSISGCDVCTQNGVCTQCSSFYELSLSFSGDLCRTAFPGCE